MHQEAPYVDGCPLAPSVHSGWICSDKWIAHCIPSETQILGFMPNRIPLPPAAQLRLIHAMPHKIQPRVLIPPIPGEVVLPIVEITLGRRAGRTNLAVSLITDTTQAAGTENHIPVGVLVGVVVDGIDRAADKVVDVTEAPGELAVGGRQDAAARFEALFDRLPLGRVVEVTRLVQRTGDVLLADDESLGPVEDVLGHGVGAVFQLHEPVPGVIAGRVRLGRGAGLRDGRHVPGPVVGRGEPR
jgi:hypothetical protein